MATGILETCDAKAQCVKILAGLPMEFKWLSPMSKELKCPSNATRMVTFPSIPLPSPVLNSLNAKWWLPWESLLAESLTRPSTLPVSEAIMKQSTSA